MSQNQNNTKYIYSIGEKIYDKYRKKTGVIKCLRDDSHEKLIRQSNPFHYCYFIEYDDDSFDTYVSVNSFIPYEEKYDNENIKFVESNLNYGKFDYKNFHQGQKFYCTCNNKNGTIRYLRDDTYEKSLRQSDPSHYYFHVDFDDGSFETYIHGMYLQAV